MKKPKPREWYLVVDVIGRSSLMASSDKLEMEAWCERMTMKYPQGAPYQLIKVREVYEKEKT